MDLKTYIQSERGNATALAEALEIPPSFLSQMASGDRAITPERAARIEVHTCKKVMRWDSRPADWHLVWPELIDADGAPAIPSVAAANEPTSKKAAGAVPVGTSPLHVFPLDRRDPSRPSPYAGTDLDRRATAGEG